MKITMPDGSTAEISAEEFEAVADIMGWKPVPEKPKTQGQLLREALEESKGEAVVNGRNGDLEPDLLTEARTLYPEAFEAQVMPDAATEAEKARSAVVVLERPAENPPEPPGPAKMPPHIDPPPVAYVTQAQSLVVELLRHHPLGLSTKDIGVKLRWDGPRSSRITTYLTRNESGALHPIITKVPGHKRYVLTEYGRRCAFKIVTNPSSYRELR